MAIELAVPAKRRRAWRSRYERMAFVVLERMTTTRTLEDIAAEIGVSHQRVFQIEKSGRGWLGVTDQVSATEIGLRARQKLRRLYEEWDHDGIQTFTLHEQQFRGRFLPPTAYD